MLLVGLSHGGAGKRNFILWFGTAGIAVKDGPVVFIDNVRKRIETIDEVFTNFEFLPVATVLDISTGLFIPPFQPFGGLQAGLSVGLVTVLRNHSNVVFLKQKSLVELLTCRGDSNGLERVNFTDVNKILPKL